VCIFIQFSKEKVTKTVTNVLIFVSIFLQTLIQANPLNSNNQMFALCMYDFFQLTSSARTISWCAPFNTTIFVKMYTYWKYQHFNFSINWDKKVSSQEGQEMPFINLVQAVFTNTQLCAYSGEGCMNKRRTDLISWSEIYIVPSHN
jgi:hypothetical protein